MKIILFSGKAEAGKSSAANIAKRILEQTGHRVLRMSYGDEVKSTAAKIFGWNGQKDEAGRKLLQWWGTDYVRARKPNYWPASVVRLAEIVQEFFDYLLIDDCRFPNEIDCWDGWDAHTVRIERPGHVSALTPEQMQHVSETALDDYRFDVTLTAENMDELERVVGEWVGEIIRADGDADV